jgi:hypothetical protein
MKYEEDNPNMLPPYFKRASGILATSVLGGTAATIFLPIDGLFAGYGSLSFFLLGFSAIFSTPVIPFLVAAFNFLEKKPWSLWMKRMALVVVGVILAFGALMLGLSIVGLSEVVWEFLLTYGGAAALSIFFWTIKYPKNEQQAHAN